MSDKAITHERLEQLRTMPYAEYLKTEEWLARRDEHLAAVDHRCQVCNTGSEPLQLHHRTYERRGNEAFADLLVLCDGCHELFHHRLTCPPEPLMPEAFYQELNRAWREGKCKLLGDLLEWHAECVLARRMGLIQRVDEATFREKLREMTGPTGVCA